MVRANDDDDGMLDGGALSDASDGDGDGNGVAGW